jgi:hypothetical protein
MSNPIHFSANNRQIPDYVLNSPRENIFEKNNLRFRIGGQYLSDFSDKGIQRFIDKNYNDKTGFLGGIGLGWGGKDLAFEEVKAFVMAAAANAEQLKNVTFDLTDPDLGLFDDDEITAKDLQHSFSLKLQEDKGTSSPSVSFVDASSASFDHRTAVQAEKKAAEALKSAEKELEKLDKNLEKALKNRDEIAERIGHSSVAKLSEADERMQSITKNISELNREIRATEKQLRSDQLQPAEKRQLSLALKGMQAEREDLFTEQKNMRKEFKEKHGFWSFLGGGNSLDELRTANRAVELARKQQEAFKGQLEARKNNHEQAQARLKAVEAGQSLSDLQSTEKPQPQPTATEKTPDPSSSVSPTQELEQNIQKLFKASPEEQLKQLNSIPPAQRQSFLKVVDDYLQAAQPDNPLGLASQDFQAVTQISKNAATLRLNALLSWPDSQNEYLSRSHNRIKEQLRQQLNEQLFAQQLTSQAQDLLNKLNGAAPKEEEIKAGPQEEVIPASPSAQPPVTAAQETTAPASTTGAETSAPRSAASEVPVTTAQVTETPVNTNEPPVTTAAPTASVSDEGLNLQSFLQLEPQQQLQRFRELQPSDQAQVFKSLDTQGKAQVLLHQTTQGIDNQAQRKQLIAQMSAEEKAQIAALYQSVLTQAGDQALAQKTELNLLISELGGKASVQPMQTPVEPAPTNSQPKQTVVTPPPSKPKNTPKPAPTTKPTPPAKPVVSSPPTPKPAASTLSTEEFLKLAPEEALDKFPQLNKSQQKEVFKRYDEQQKTEILLALTVRTPHAQMRSELIGLMSPAEKQATARILQESLPAVESIPELVNGITDLLKALGSPAPSVNAPPTPAKSPTQQPSAAPQGTVDLGQINLAPPSAENAPPSVAPPKISQDAELTQLNKLLQNKTYFGYGGVAEPQKVSELAEQIWVNGTAQNRQSLAKMLVDNGQAVELGRILGNMGVSDQEVVSTLTHAQFPTTRFFKDIDDNRAYLMLYSLASAAASGDKASQQIISTTIDAYTQGLDREKPISRMKNQAVAEGIWNKLPQDIRTKTDKILSSWWN